MTQVTIVEAGGLTSRGYLLDENTNTPVGTGHPGPHWAYELSPSNYIFECDVSGVAGKAVTVTVSDPTGEIAKTAGAIPGAPGTLGAGTLWVRFAVA
jgi:hypothetical protein